MSKPHKVKPVRVQASSASHEKFPPENLLNPNDKTKKWKSREQGQKKAFVVLELSEPTEINGVDIGNEHSCFIEVLVGHKGFVDTDFKELLLTSSFQTPNESRNSENPNRVRCFSKPALVESVASQKWELVKIVCTQPFNSRVHYGLSFITLYTPEESKKEAAVLPKIAEEVPKKTLFSFREKSPESDTENGNSTSLFARWKQSKGNDGPAAATPARVSAAAAIRDARSSPSSFADRKSPLVVTSDKPRPKKPSTEAPSTPVLDRNRNRLMYDDDDPEEGDEKLEKLIEKDKKRAEVELRKPSTPVTKKVKLSDPEEENKIPASSRIFSDPVDSSSAGTEKSKEKPRKPKVYKPFAKLLEGVVLTISGIQNPERGTLRAKALEMGAKYKADWDDSCTHLICAFKNTPKYNQVHGIGKIVKRDWVLKCHANKKHIPWRRYALDSKEADQSESEDEIFDEEGRVEDLEDGGGPSSSPAATGSDSAKTQEDEEDDVMMIYDKDEPVIVCDSGPDTEDEIEEVKTQMPRPREKNDEREGKESVDEPAKGEKGEFFAGRRFFLDEDIGAVKIIKLYTIISKFGGKVIESKEDSDYWIKSSKLNPPTPALLNKNCRVLKPLWLEETADMECWLPLKRYLH